MAYITFAYSMHILGVRAVLLNIVLKNLEVTDSERLMADAILQFYAQGNVDSVENPGILSENIFWAAFQYHFFN